MRSLRFSVTGVGLLPRGRHVPFRRVPDKSACFQPPTDDQEPLRRLQVRRYRRLSLSRLECIACACKRVVSSACAMVVVTVVAVDFALALLRDKFVIIRYSFNVCTSGCDRTKEAGAAACLGPEFRLYPPRSASRACTRQRNPKAREESPLRKHEGSSRNFSRKQSS